MKVRLKKSWKWGSIKTFHIGTVLEVVDPVAKKMVSEGTAEVYTGPYPPKGKMRTDFFKQKT
jgi:hypothetical protein